MAAAPAVPTRSPTRGIATSATMFMRTVGQALGAAVFGAVLNLGISRGTPEALGAVNRLLDPVQRLSLGAGELARLSGVIASSLHEVYVIAGALALAAFALALRLPAGLSPLRKSAGH